MHSAARNIMIALSLIALSLIASTTALNLANTATPDNTVAPSFSSSAATITTAPTTTSPSPRDNNQFTISIYTKGSIGDFYIRWENKPKVPTPASNPTNTRLSSTTQAVFPPGWAGHVAIGRDADQAVINRGSRIEASFGGGKNSYDVSYVLGYSIPIVCSCQDMFNSGCNIPLYWQETECPSKGPGNTCYNPESDSTQPQGFFAQKFFEPCQGAAKTYPNDIDAVKSCAENKISCCVGHGCPAAKQQKSQGIKRGLGGHVQRSEAAE